MKILRFKKVRFGRCYKVLPENKEKKAELEMVSGSDIYFMIY